MKEKIAIIGAGVAGLTAAYLLNEKYEVTLFEKSDRIGGNACTYQASTGEQFDIAVAVFDTVGYKNFFKLLSRLKIKSRSCFGSYMSLHNLDTKKGLYITPWSVRGLVSQKFALLKPRNVYSLLNTIVGINRIIRLLERKELEGLTMREALSKIPQFQGNSLLLFMFFLCLALSMHYEKIMDGPAEFFISKIKWLMGPTMLSKIYSLHCVRHNTQSYIQALKEKSNFKTVLNSKISKVTRDKKGVTVHLKDGGKTMYNKIIFACNADQALELIEKPSKEEKRLLGAWRYNNGPVVVHRDYSSFPKRELCQGFTFLYNEKKGKINTSVNGSIWHQADVSNSCEFIGSQYPNFPIKDNLIEVQKVFRTPVYDWKSVPAIAELPSLNGKMNSYFCGSHFGYGLHEDAVTSAIRVAEALGISWE